MRAIRIAVALRDDGFQVHFVTGGAPIAGLDTYGMVHTALPAMAVKNGDFSVLVDAEGKPIDEPFREQRCRYLLDAFRESRPDVVLLEAFPFGRRQLRFELLPLLDEIENTNPRPVVATSIRDILQQRQKPGRDEETIQLLIRHFDKILVHGDPCFIRLDESFPLARQISDRIAYTGLVSGPESNPPSEQFDAVVSAGGGAVGLTLLRCAVNAAKLLPELKSWCVLTGPNLPEAEFADLARSAPDNVSVERFRHDICSLLCGARLSVSQAGYNTVCDVLQATCHCVLVPYSANGETEQTQRAQRLKQLKLAAVVSEPDLSVDSLALAVRESLNLGVPDTNNRLRLDGAEVTAKILRQTLQ